MSALYAVRLANGEWWTCPIPCVWTTKYAARLDMQDWRAHPDNRKTLRKARVVRVTLVESPDAA